MRILVLILVALALLLGLFYTALRDRVRDVSKEEPFKALIGKPLRLTRSMQVVQEPKTDAMEGLPSLWEHERTIGPSVSLISTATAGTPLTIERALLHRGGVSGITHAIVIGTLELPSGTVPFSLYWGQQHVLYVERPYWTFPMAPWQQQALSDPVFLPEP